MVFNNRGDFCIAARFKALSAVTDGQSKYHRSESTTLMCKGETDQAIKVVLADLATKPVIDYGGYQNF